MYYGKYTKYKYKYLKLKNSNQIGGNEEILTRMREFERDFVLIIGSSEHELHYREFTCLQENVDKMIISIDLSGDGTNNFSLDFNEESTWRILSEFNGRFITIIFDFAVDKFINYEATFDIMDKIKNLLKINGKLYKYYSYGRFFISSNINKELITRNFQERDLNIILEQFHNSITEEELDKIFKIEKYNIYKTDFGYFFSDFNLIYKNIQIKQIAPEFTNMFISIESPHIFKYLKSMYLFYNQLFYSNLLQNKYGFSTEVVETCESYPLKCYNPARPSVKLFKYDYCYIVCTKLG
jgi:hypothetical protein